GGGRLGRLAAAPGWLAEPVDPLHLGDLVDPAAVPSPFEVGVEPDLDDPGQQPVPQHVRRQAHDVGVVVTSADLGGEVVVAGDGPHPGKLVGGDAHTHAGPADQNAPIDLAPRDVFRNEAGEIRIVHTVARMGTVVD